MAILHFWLAQVAMLGLTVGLWLLYAGNPQYEPIAAISSLAYGVSFLVFAAIALPIFWSKSD